MGIFDFFRTRDKETPEVEPPVDDLLLKALLDGETITREKALTIPAVSGAVDFVSNAVACMPVKLYKVEDGEVKEVKDDRRVKLLNGDTGDTLDAFQIKKAMVEDYLLGKGGYCYICRPFESNEVTSLHYVEDRWISIMRIVQPIFKEYTILVEGGEYQPYEFIKLLRNTKDGASGIGLTVEIAKCLETAYQTLLYQLGLVKTGGNKKGFLKSERRLGKEEIEALKNAWKRQYSNSSESIVVLNQGLEFQESSNNSVEMQLNENKKTLQDEINSIFHIYPNDFHRTYKEAIYPIVKAFETALNRDLLLLKEHDSYFFEFDVKEILRANAKEEAETLKLYKEIGVKSTNEMRKQLNLNYIEGLDVVNVGLGAVLYDINTHQYYTPNTDTTTNLAEKENKMLEGHIMEEEFKASGNSSNA